MGRGCRRAWGTARQALAASELCPLRAGLYPAADTGEAVHSCRPSRRGISELWPGMDGHGDTGSRSAGLLQPPASGVSEKATR